MDKVKVEIAMRNLEWKIEDCKEDVERARKSIEREMANFNEVTSPMWIAQYSKEMLEARNNLRLLHERKREVEWLVSEFVEA